MTFDLGEGNRLRPVRSASFVIVMTRAVTALREHVASVLQLHRLQAATLIHNAASQGVLTSNGFEHIGTARKYLRIARKW